MNDDKKPKFRFEEIDTRIEEILTRVRQIHAAVFPDSTCEHSWRVSGNGSKCRRCGVAIAKLRG